MYLKVPLRKDNSGTTKSTTVEEVEAVLREIDGTEGCTVDDDLRHPSIEFPKRTQYEEFVRVREALNARGFEAY